MNDIRKLRNPSVVDFASTAYAKIKPVAVTAVSLRGDFWGKRFETNRTNTLLTQWDLLESTGRLNNFRRIYGAFEGPFEGIYFNDTDLYKWLEAASWIIARGPDPELQKRVDEGIEMIERAQEADGYINTYFSKDRPDEKFANLRDLHELYTGGHLIQAAIAHHRATSDGRLLDVAVRFADLLCKRFGPAAEGKVEGVDGHEEIEMALVELARETGQSRYLELASYFVKARGYGLLKGGRFGDAYYQDHVPFDRMEDLDGHAVRALYMVCGVTDLYLETGEAALLSRLERLWDRLTASRMYISGGVGSRWDGESIGADFELPNAQAYTETCAAIASMMWCHRLLAATGNARYADLFEWTLYNGLLPGWSLDGQSYYYVNPLENDGTHRRRTWYFCACCPPNVARTIASLPGYVYGTDHDSLYVQQYFDSDATVDVAGKPIGIRQTTRYPWEGGIDIEIDGEAEFTLKLRIPGWASNQNALSSRAGAENAVTIAVNGSPVNATPNNHGYVEVRRNWTHGDRVRLELPMPVRVWQSHPKVPDNRGRIALSRGPVLYCVEQADVRDVDLDEVFIDISNVNASWEPTLLDGVVALKSIGQRRTVDPSWSDNLYRPYGSPRESQPTQGQGVQSLEIVAIPYFAWHNRESGPMKVWLNYRES